MTPRREAYKREIQLVSGGYYAPQAFPGGKITVYPWDSNVDAWFQERLRQPKRDFALWEVVTKVANLNGVDYKKLLVGDILTILMVSRSILSECIIDYNAVCPNCNRQHPDKVNIPDGLEKNGAKAPDFKGTDLITLPKSNDVVEIRYLSVGDEMGISERSAEEKALINDSQAIILYSIATVGGGRPEDKEELLTWYNALPPKDAEALRKGRMALTPQLDPDLKIRCDGCGNVFTHTLDLQRDFFRGD